MTDKEWQSLQDEIVSRIDNIFSSRPTWSRWPNMEAEMLQSIQQAIRDEIYLVKSRKKKSCSKAQMSR